MEIASSPFGESATEFRRAFARMRPEIDLVFDMTATAITGPVAPEIPVALWTLGNLPRGAGLLSIRRRQLKSTDVLLVNSSADLSILERTLAPGGIHGAIVPFGIDADTFRPADPGELSLGRRRFDLPPGGPLLVFSGRINVQKNLHSLLHLVSALAVRVPTLTLAIAGMEDRIELKQFGTRNVGYHARLIDLAQRLGVSERVRFLGLLGDSDLALLLRSADVFVSLSLHHDENFGYAPLEAMASGIPAVVSDWGGYRDSVGHGHTGLRIPTFMTSNGVRVAWRRAIEPLAQLLASPRQRAAFGRAGRVRVERHFGHAAAAATLERTLRAAAARRGEVGVFGGTGFRFHAMALKLQARNALLHLAHERADAPFDLRLTPADYPTYRFFLGPYATTDVGELSASPEDRPSLLVEVLEVASGIETRDPIWPGRYDLEPALVSAVAAADGVLTIAELAVHHGIAEGLLVTATTALARAGVVDLGREVVLAADPQERA